MYDYLIIGSGFGGSVSALRLAEKGYTVAILEAGKRYDNKDFPRTNWNIFKHLWIPFLRCFGILRITPMSHVLVLSGSGLGGGSLGYANVHIEPPDTFFNDSQWAAMGDWKTRLEPHYNTAREMLGVTLNRELYPADILFKEIADEMGRGHTFRQQNVGVYFGEPEKTMPDPYFNGKGPERTGCSFCGGCMVGCPNNSKNTLDKNYLYLAEKFGVKIFTETKASLINELPGGGYRVDTKKSTSFLQSPGPGFETRNLILSGGVLGTVDLLMKCREKGTLPNISSMLGARVRTNSEALLGVSAKNDDVDYSKGVAITSSIFPDDVTHIEPVRYPDGSDLLGFLATIFTDGGNPRTRPVKWLRNICLSPLIFLRTLWPFGWARRSIILLVMQTLDNSVRVKRKRRWWFPFNKGFVSKPENMRERVPAYIPVAQETARRLAKKIDGIPQNAINEVLLDVGTTAHILGGCVIGSDKENGVIDGQNRVYGHEGLYIIDGSMIPANLGVNPSLTITAMAEYAMSHIPDKTD